jgi:hypothetical protein
MERPLFDLSSSFIGVPGFCVLAGLTALSTAAWAISYLPAARRRFGADLSWPLFGLANLLQTALLIVIVLVFLGH